MMRFVCCCSMPLALTEDFAVRTVGLIYLLALVCRSRTENSLTCKSVTPNIPEIADLQKIPSPLSVSIICSIF